MGRRLPPLKPSYEIFVEHMAAGENQTAAARAAGFKDAPQAGVRLIRRPDVQEHLAAALERNRREMQMTREKVQEGLLEAVAMARANADAGSMIRGWAEIAKLCGLYGPEQKQVEVSAKPQVRLDQLERLSNCELFELIGGSVDEMDLALEEAFG